MSALRGSTTRLGRVMIILAWVVLLIMLTTMFGNLLHKRFNPNTDPEAMLTGDGRHAVTLKRNPQGHYVASGFINGYPVTFLVDTGATDVALSEPLAEKLGLEKRGGGFSQTANGVVAVWQTLLDEVRLGPVRSTGVRASILPGTALGAEVLLGMSFLKHLELRQKDGELTLVQ